MTKSRQPRDDKAVKIRRELAVKAKVIAESKGITIAEYLSALLESAILKDWPKAIAAIEKQNHESDRN